MSFNLIDSFRAQGWDFLIPANLQKTATGEYINWENEEDDEVNTLLFTENTNHSHRYDDYEPDIWDLEHYNDNDDDEEQNSAIYEESMFETLYDLKYDTDNDDLSDEEFLSLSAGQLLGITNAQLKFVSENAIREVGLGRYKDFLADKTNKLSSIEQKIKYTNVIAQARATNILLHGEVNTPQNKKQLEQYIINISLKHDECTAIQLLNLYKDYINMYHGACEINEENKANGNPYFDYQLFPKPSHIKDLHDKASRDYSTLMSRLALQRENITNEAIKMFVKGDLYRKNLYKGDKYSVISANSAEDLLNEGKVLEHCVASYIDDFARGNTYIYFIRRNEDVDTPFYTVELLPCRKNKRGYIMYMNQCYGYKDTIDKPDSLYNFIKEWCEKKKIDIRCEI